MDNPKFTNRDKAFLTALKYFSERDFKGCKKNLAALGKISNGYLSELLNFKKICKPVKQAKLAEACGCSYEEFIQIGEKILSNEYKNPVVFTASGVPVGDVLLDILFASGTDLNFTEAEYAKKLEIPLEELRRVMRSQKPPSWKMLQKLFCKLGININFLVAGPHIKMMGTKPERWPVALIDRIAQALDIEDDIALADFLNEHWKDIKRIRKKEASLSPKIRKIIIDTGINPAWIQNGSLPSHLIQKHEKMSNINEPSQKEQFKLINKLVDMHEKQIVELKQEKKELQQELKQTNIQKNQLLEENEKKLKEIVEMKMAIQKLKNQYQISSDETKNKKTGTGGKN